MPIPLSRFIPSCAALLLLSACATSPDSSPAGAASAPRVAAGAGATPAGAAPPAVSPGGALTRSGAAAVAAAAPTGAAPSSSASLPAFEALTKEARRVEGPLVLWQKDERVWIELRPQQFGQPFLLSPKVRSGVGEGMVLGGLMSFPVNGAGGALIVEFVRMHNSVRLQARNTDVFARPGTPEARAVAAAYSASLLGATPVASQPHPERKSILIDAGSLFLTDLSGVGMQLQRSFRQGYSLDRANSTITGVRGSAQASIIETLNHYYTGNVSTVQTGAPSSGPAPQVPRFVPDARSLLVGMHYSLMALPEQPMPTRRADARLGHFTSTVLDFSDDLVHTPRRRVVNRWRLEKKDPAAELSDPVQPITFWIDRNVPLAYRDAVRSGILEWNKAFEAIGFRNAIVVQQQPDDAVFDTLDAGVASVRWMTNADTWLNAIGPTHVDPRTGEILDADVAIEGMSLRNLRADRTQVLGTRAAIVGGAAPASFAQPFGFEAASAAHEYCSHAQMAAEQVGYAIDVLEARGEVVPGDMTTQQFVLDYIKDTVMHEMGHALGLRHNFRASRVYSEQQLADPEFTRTHGTSGSVMEYNPINLPRPGERGGAPFQTTLGPYDYWAIDYAYRPLPPGLGADEQEHELLRIAARSAEPLLAFGSDEDSFFGIDPETMQWDLGADPLAFASKRLAIARDLFQRQETRILPGDRDYAVLRRSLGYALSDVFRAVGVLVRHVGGVRTLRDFPGSGRDPLQPVAPEVQRAALDLIARSVLALDGLRVTPALQRRLAPDFFERAEMPGLPTDYAVPQRLLDLQRSVLGYLLSDTVAARLLDSVDKFDQPAQALRLSELYARLSTDVWSELGGAAPFTAARRDLQRDHANRLAAALLRPAAGQRADARSLLRQETQQLLGRIDARLRRGAALDTETRAHLLESADTLRQALSARVVRSSV